ncbi:MAG: AAA family ATPase [Nitrospira sp.]|nr:AAA family ATPase [Nitrospira sp.]
MSLHEIDTQTEPNVQAEPLSVLIQQYWGNIVSRKWVVLCSAAAGLMIAAILCVVLPKSYRSNTLILIENQKIPEDYVKGIGGANIEQRLTMIHQQVMSRTFLSQIRDEYKLYEELVRREGLEPAIETLRKLIKVETVGTPGVSGKSVEAITLSFAHEDPTTAMNVTAKLASLFIQENIRSREQLVTGVMVFLEQELHDAKKSLETKERTISEFKTRYVNELPEQKEANLRTLDRLQTELNTTVEAYHSLTARQSLSEKAVAKYEQYESIQSSSSQPMPRMGNQPIQNPLVIRLSELQKQLATLMGTYKETYPDVVYLKDEIKQLEAQIVEQTQITEQNKHSQAEESQPDSNGRAGRLFDPQLQNLLAQRDEAKLEILNLKTKEARIIREMKEIEGRVQRTPSREQELMILVRDYDNMQSNYQALLNKRLNAHVAENLEKRQQGEQIRVLDPANLPQKPEKPNQLLILLLGLIGGAGLGVGLALGIDQLNPTFKRREEVEVLPDINVLATIPQFFTLSSPVSVMPMSTPRITGSDSHRVLEGKSGNRNGLNPENFNLIAKWQPRSVAAEQYRMAATKLTLSTEGRNSTVVEITSALMGEGKTTTVVNLGYTIARDLGKKTLLIDCDFQRPALHHYAMLPARAGLIEFLDGQASLDECLSVIDESPCAILATGGGGGEKNEFARIQQLKAMLPQLRVQFEYLIINTPPVLSNATMGILASLADELVWVIRAGHSPKHLVQKAFIMLGLTGQRNVILNGVDAQSMSHHIYGYTLPYGGDRAIESVRR